MPHDTNQSTLHEQLKLAEKQVQRAADDLNDARIYYTNDPSDHTRENIVKANGKLKVAVARRDELLDQVVNEDWY